MDSAVSIKDVLKRSFLESELFFKDLTWEKIIQILISLCISLIAGLIIYYIYKKTYRGVIYSQTFAITLVGMCVLTCMVTLAISTNVVLSLGMVGALSIVRYRTAIKEPMDLLFIFWTITAGITVGAHMYWLVLAASIVMIILILLLGRKKTGKRVYIMIVHYTGDDISDEIRKIMAKIRYIIRSKTIRRETTELAVELYTRKDNLAFLERIRELENVEDVSLVQYNGEYNG